MVNTGMSNRSVKKKGSESNGEDCIAHIFDGRLADALDTDLEIAAVSIQLLKSAMYRSLFHCCQWERC